MNKPQTCGQGLAERSALPAKLASLSAAMADTVERHQRTLDLSDPNAREELDAYQAVGGALRAAAAQLQATADRMLGYTGLPAARHDERALMSAENRDVFAAFIEREEELSALLNASIEQDRAMLGETRTAGSLALTRVPIATTGMLIRRPVADVFEAIVDPAVTTNFWFTKSSGRLEVGKRVQWKWEMYNVSIDVTTKVIEPNARIVIEWPGYNGPTTIEWTFKPHDNGTTFVGITESGFTGSGDELVKYTADSTQGFTLMLAGLKAFLEHGIKLNLTADRYPEGIG